MFTTRKRVVVVYRWSEDGGVFALLPEVPGAPGGFCTAYQHVGQQCSADYAACIKASRPATEDEYRSLHEELGKVGYNNLVIREVP